MEKMTKKQQYEILKALQSADEERKRADAEYERLRGLVDEMTSKQTTTYDFYGKAVTVVYDATTTTKTDYNGLMAEFGITKEDKERYTTRVASTRFKAVI